MPTSFPFSTLNASRSYLGRLYVPVRIAGLFILALSLLLFSLLGSQPAQARQSTPVIKYGQTVKGTIGGTSDYAALYNFQARAGDRVTIKAVRNSGTLRPLLGLIDPTLPAGKEVIVTSDLSTDGKTALISNFSITKTQQYQIVVTRESASKGTTAGNFSMTLTNAVTATPTPVPTIEPTVDNSGAANTHSFTVGTEPVYSVWSGNNLYVANQGDGTVSILDDSGTVTGTIQTGGAPFAMSWDGARLWVADFGTDAAPGNSVTLYDAAGKKLNTYKVGKQPISLSYDPEDLLTWIALYGDDKIVAVDAHGKITHTVDVSGSGHNPNTVLWTGTLLWVTLQGTDKTPGNMVLSIDPTGAITNTVTVGQLPADLAWDDADQTVFVANNGDGTVTAINATDGSIIGTYKVGTSPSALAWDGTHLWVTLATENTAAALDKNGKVLTKVPLDASPNGITFDGQSSVWVALQGTTDQPGNTIVQIDISAAQ